MKSGSLNLLEPYGPHRACNGTPLPLPVYPQKTEECSAAYNKTRKKRRSKKRHGEGDGGEAAEGGGGRGGEAKD